MTDPEWQARFDAKPVTGDCDSGCGKPARKWFGQTSCATCGDIVCIAKLQADYDPGNLHPDPTQKDDQLQQLAKDVALLDLVATPPGAAFVLGVARGRLNALRDLGLLTMSETEELAEEIRGRFTTLWPGLFNEAVGRQ